MFSVLSKHIDDLDKTTSLRESDVPDRVATIGHIETLVRRELHADAEVEVFGSSAVGTDLPKSDVDIAINYDTIWKRWLDQGGDRDAPQDIVNEAIKPDMIHAARKVAGAIRRDPELKKRKVGFTIAITKCRVPLVRTSCEINGLRKGIDIVFGQKNGIAAARWTRDMIENVHPELRPLTKCVKALLKQKNLGDVSKGGLGGHAVTCALVCYLNHLKRNMKDEEEEEAETRGNKAEKEDGELEVRTVDLDTAFVGFLREMGNLNLEREVLTLDKWRAPKPSGWMTEDEFGRSGRHRSAAPARGFTAKDPPRLGVEDPADCDRNLCAGSHDARRVLEGFRDAMYNNGLKSKLDRFFNVEEAVIGHGEDYGFPSKRRGEHSDRRPGKVAKTKGGTSTKLPPPDL